MKKLFLSVVSIVVTATMLLSNACIAYASEIKDYDVITVNTQYIDNVYENEHSYRNGLGDRILYYMFNIPQRGSLSIDFKHQIANYGDGWSLYLYGYNNDGYLERIDYDSVGTKESAKNIGTFGLSAGEYFLEINTDTKADYSLNLIFSPSNNFEVEFNDDLDAATKIYLGSTIFGNTSNSGYYNLDYDFFSVDIINAGNYDISFLAYPITKSNDANWTVNFGKYASSTMFVESEIFKTTLFKNSSNLSLFKTVYLTPGTYYFEIVGSKGNYSLNISAQSKKEKSSSKKPKSTSIKKVKAAKKAVSFEWKKVSGVKGYQVQVATDKKFKKNKKTVTIKKQKTTKTTVKKLKAKKKYYVRIRTYKTVKGKKVYSSWSKVKTVKTK